MYYCHQQTMPVLGPIAERINLYIYRCTDHQPVQNSSSFNPQVIPLTNSFKMRAVFSVLLLAVVASFVQSEPAEIMKKPENLGPVQEVYSYSYFQETLTYF